jgi:dienelactone hydrolase
MRSALATLRALAILGHVYSAELLGRSLVAPFTARPRRWETSETFGGVPMRVGWWRPGRGRRHPAMLWVIGATPEGIDFPQLAVAAEGFARGGFLLMVPDLPFMKEERLDPSGPAQIAEAFASLVRHPAAAARPGAFGFSIGGGVLLAAAAQDERFHGAAYLAVLGAYFDIATYVASVASRRQRRDGRLVAWDPSPDVPERLAGSAAKLAHDAAERAALDDVLTAASYDEVLARLGTLPAGLREALERLSPRAGWERIGPPIFWLHDERDQYVPVAELEAARLAPGRSALRSEVVRLLQHAVPVANSARGRGFGFWLSELGKLLRFALAVLRAAG